MIVVILAGGKGTRLGTVDKGEIDLGECRLIDQIVSTLSLQGADLVISGRNDYGLGFETIPDQADGPKGPVAGLYAAFQSLRETQEEGFFTVPVDGPNLPKDLLPRLYRREGSAIARDDAGLHPTFAWWRFEDLGEAFAGLDVSQSISLKRLAEMTQAKRVRWVGHTLFANINTANDLAQHLNK